MVLMHDQVIFVEYTLYAGTGFKVKNHVKGLNGIYALIWPKIELDVCD